MAKLLRRSGAWCGRASRVATVAALVSLSVVVLASAPSSAASEPAGYGKGASFCALHGGGPNPATLSYDDVYACATYSGGSAPDGATPFDSNGDESFQCVELSDRFLWAVYGLWVGPGDDGGALNGYNLVTWVGQTYHVAYANTGANNIPSAGDVVSFQPGNGYDADVGHTAVVISSDPANDTFKMLSENFLNDEPGVEEVKVGTGAESGRTEYSTNDGASWDGAWDQTNYLELNSWSNQSAPVPSGSSAVDFASTSCPTTTFCEAVGGATSASKVTRFAAEEWNGSDWSVQSVVSPTGENDSALSSVSCPTTTFCAAVGSGRRGLGAFHPAIRLWNGTTWTSALALAPNGSAWSELNGVSCTSSTACMAVGQYAKGKTDYGMSERWNGTAWLLRTVPAPSFYPDETLNAVSCQTGASCVAVGTANLVDGDSNPIYEGVVEQWTGSRWVVRPPHGEGGVIGNFLDGVTCTAASECFAVGYSEAKSGVDSVLIERDTNNNWGRVASPATPAATYTEMFAVACGSPTSCTSVGYDNANRSIATALIEAWNGTSWSVAVSTNPSGVTEDVLSGVSCASSSVCVAVGSAGSEST